MIKVKKILLNNIDWHVSKTKDQLNQGTGEILDFEGWNPAQFIALEAYFISLKLNNSMAKRIKLRNINVSQRIQVKRSLETVSLELLKLKRR